MTGQERQQQIEALREALAWLADGVTEEDPTRVYERGIDALEALAARLSGLQDTLAWYADRRNYVPPAPDDLHAYDALMARDWPRDDTYYLAQLTTQAAAELASARAQLEQRDEALRAARAFVAGVDLHGAQAEIADQWRYAILPRIDAALAGTGEREETPLGAQTTARIDMASGITATQAERIDAAREAVSADTPEEEA